MANTTALRNAPKICCEGNPNLPTLDDDRVKSAKRFKDQDQFKTEDEIKGWVGENTDPWQTKADDAQRKAFARYTKGKDGAINKGLRKKGLQDMPAPDAELVGQMDSVFDNFDTTIKNDVVAYRGGFLPTGGKKGTIFRDDGFISTSLSPRKARVFADNEGEWLMEIIVPKGSKGAFLETVTRMGGEHELLLPRGTRFRIRSVRMASGRSAPRLGGGIGGPVKFSRPVNRAVIEVIP